MSSSVSLSSFPRVFTAVVTPFLPVVGSHRPSVDLSSFEKVFLHSISAGVGVIVFGTTGESPVLTDKEKHSVLTLVQQLQQTHAIPSALIAIGVGGNNTDECIEQGQLAFSFGFTTLMVTTPYYNKPSMEGCFQHFVTIHDSLVAQQPKAQFIIYNVPGRTNVNLLPETVQKIVHAAPHYVAIKEASGNLAQMIAVRSAVPQLLFYSGDDGLLIPVLSIGGYGVISVLSNSAPQRVKHIIDTWLQGQVKQAFELFQKEEKLINALFSETNPVPIKTLLHLDGVITSPAVRLPLIPMIKTQVIAEFAQTQIQTQSPSESPSESQRK